MRLTATGYNLYATGGLSEKHLDLQRKVVCTKERATPLNSKIIFLPLKVIEHNRMERQP
jgi:hypothetical protein